MLSPRGCFHSRTKPAAEASGSRPFGWRRAVALVALPLWALTCTFPDFDVTEPSSGSTGGSTGSGAGASTGAVGGAPPCESDSQCPESDTECARRSCEDGVCKLVPEPARTRCSDGGELCDGRSACVQCLDAADCDGGVECSPAGLCVAEHCSNEAQDGGETGVDCGGVECPPCGRGARCDDATDCASGFCSTGECAPCGATSDCAGVPDSYCEANGVCTPKKGLGVSCAAPVQCQSGYCPEGDGVCCQQACSGQCVSCSGNLTGGETGSCGFIPQGQDPQGECLLDTEVLLLCNGSGACTLLGG